MTAPITPPQTFSPAHKVVIDAVTFVAALTYVADPRLPLAIDALDRALPMAHATGWPDLDRVILAGTALSRAWVGRRQNLPQWGTDWMAANMDANAAVTGFAWWRLALSTDALFPQPELAHG